MTTVLIVNVLIIDNYSPQLVALTALSHRFSLFTPGLDTTPTDKRNIGMAHAHGTCSGSSLVLAWRTELEPEIIADLQ